MSNMVETVMTKCDFKGCANAPEFAPRVNVPFKGISLDQQKPLEAYIGLRLCLLHVNGVKIEDFNNLEPLFDQLVKSQNLPDTLQPDWGRAWISKIKLDSKEYMEFEGIVPRGSA